MRGRGGGGEKDEGTGWRKKERNTGEGRDAAHKENAGVESPRHLYSLLTESLQDLSRISSRTVCRSVESGTGRGRKERQHNAREDRETLSASSRAPPPPLPKSPLAGEPSEATEILEASLCFWLLERVKIPPRKTLSECKGSLKMFRKRRAARII